MACEKSDAFYKSLLQHEWVIEPLRKQLLGPKTSVKVGGPADFIIAVSNETELVNIWKLINKYKIPWFVLGKGTNLLVKDQGFPGAVIVLKGSFLDIEIINNQLIAGAGTSSKKLSKFARQNSLSGIEFLTTIPGTIGGAIYMNAGAHGSQMKDVIKWVRFLDQDGIIETLKNNQLGFSYRHSFFSDRSAIILKAGLVLKNDTQENIVEKEKKMIQKRKESQPIDKHTWGSVFVNPPNYSAGQLIDSCNLKGKGFGKAVISPKHANFIENTGGATFDDLNKTIELARTMVLNKYNILLKSEGRIIPEEK